MDWKSGDFCVAKSSSQDGSVYNAKILEVFASRRKARVKDIRYGDIEEVSIEDLKSFGECAVNKAGILMRSNDIEWPGGWKEGDDCTARWEVDGRSYNAKVLKIFNVNEVLVYFVDYGNADFTRLGDILSYDFTLTCGENEWKVSSVILSRWSPFFKAAVANRLNAEMEMKLEIKDLDPQAMQEVLNYMHSVPIKADGSLFGPLLEASERFQMNGLKEEVVEIGRKCISKENAVEIGKLAELYDSKSLLHECIEFIVENGVKIEEGNSAPKLMVGVLKEFKSYVKYLRYSRGKAREEKNDILLAKDELEDELGCVKDCLEDSLQENERLKEEKDQLNKENEQLFHRLKKVEMERDKYKEAFYNAKVEAWEVEQERESLLERDAMEVEEMDDAREPVSSEGLVKEDIDDDKEAVSPEGLVKEDLNDNKESVSPEGLVKEDLNDNKESVSPKGLVKGDIDDKVSVSPERLVKEDMVDVKDIVNRTRNHIVSASFDVFDKFTYVYKKDKTKVKLLQGDKEKEVVDINVTKHGDAAVEEVGIALYNGNKEDVSNVNNSHPVL